jgi:hypothetical protein
MNKYGWHTKLIGSLGVWWNYDLTLGAAWSWNHLNRRGRFYGITIGMCCIGITVFKKES